jgi:hypothetical protein
MKKIINLSFILSLSLIAVNLFGFSGTERAKAGSATFYLSPSSGNFKVGQSVSISLMINSGGAAINAGEGSVTFSPDILKYQSVSTSGSIFTFWTSGPVGGDTSVSFGGGLASPGYNGSSGKALTISFKAQKAGTASITVNGTRILANDGVGTNIIGGNSGGSYTVAEAQVVKYVVKIESPSHPEQDKWYPNNRVDMNWTANEAKSYLIAFDQSATETPSEQTAVTSKTYENNVDGIWYFHAQAKGDSGDGPVAHYTVQIDVTPPEPFEINIDREFGIFDLSPKVIFEAKDATSGIDKYEVIINGGEPSIITSGDNLPKMWPGDYPIVIKAYDKAGNVRESKTDLKIGGPASYSITIFGYEIPVKYIIYILLILLIVLLILDFCLWRKMRRLASGSVAVVGVAYGKIKQIFVKTEKDIDREIDDTIPTAELSRGAISAMKRDLKKKIHGTIEKEEDELEKRKDDR